MKNRKKKREGYFRVLTLYSDFKDESIQNKCLEFIYGNPINYEKRELGEKTLIVIYHKCNIQKLGRKVGRLHQCNRPRYHATERRAGIQSCMAGSLFMYD